MRTRGARVGIVVALMLVGLATAYKGTAHADLPATCLTLTQSKATSQPHELVIFTTTLTDCQDKPVSEGDKSRGRGVIVLYHNGSIFDSGVPDTNGQVKFHVNTFEVGFHNMRTEYRKSEWWAPSDSPTVNHTVPKAESSVTVTTSPNPSNPAQKVKMTATVFPHAAITSTVSFSVDGGVYCTVPTNGVPEQSCEVGPLTIGQHTLQAHYSGTATQNSSVSDPVIQNVVGVETQTVLWNSSPAPSYVGQEVTLTASVTVKGTNVPVTQGTVTFEAGTTTVCTTVPVDPDGIVQCRTSSLPAGQTLMHLVYNPTDAFGKSETTRYVYVVDKTGATTTLALASSVNPSEVGQDVTFTAAVTANGAPVGEGIAELIIGNQPFKQVEVGASGIATFTVSELFVPGTHSVSANYLGTPNYAGSGAVVLQKVNKVVTATTVTSSQNPSEVGTPVTFTASVTSKATGAPVTQGSVIFSEDGADKPVAALDGNGQASYSTAALVPGPHQITVRYVETPERSPSASAPHEQTVTNLQTTTVVVSDANPSQVGQPVTFTATVTTSAGPATGGTVTFRDGSDVLNTVAPDATGKATTTVPALSAGAHPITAEYSGTPTVDGSNGQLQQTVSKLVTTTSLTSSATSVAVNETVTFTATVMSDGKPVTDGTVDFVDDPICLDVPLSADGTATCSTAALGAGSHTITATYSGGPTFDTSSAELELTVNAPAAPEEAITPNTPSASSSSSTSTASTASAPSSSRSNTLARTGGSTHILLAIGLLLISLGAHLRWGPSKCGRKPAPRT